MLEELQKTTEQPREMMTPEDQDPNQEASGSEGNRPPPLPPPPVPSASAPPPPIPPSSGSSEGPPPPPGAPMNPAANMVPTGHYYQNIDYTQISAHRNIVAILYIIGGIISTMVGFGILLGVCCYPIWFIQIFGGVAGIFIGINMLANKTFPPNSFIAWSFVLGILGCDFISMTIGIVLIFLLENRELRDYYAKSGIVY